MAGGPGFPFRDGDIVVSTRSKHGTTWVQAICLMLVLGTPDLPAPLGELSPWLDWRVTPRDEVWALLAAQRHRRVVKTHTPLDGVPIDRRATYVVVARHPLDAAVSLYHQGDNIDRARLRALTGAAGPADDGPRPPADEWLRAWIGHDADPRAELDSLAGVMWHLGDAWARRHEPNVVLVHYEDLSADLDARDAAARRAACASRCPSAAWPALVAAAGFESMRTRARRPRPRPRGRPAGSQPVLPPRDVGRGSAAADAGRPGCLSGSRRSRWPRRACSHGCTVTGTCDPGGHGRGIRPWVGSRATTLTRGTRRRWTSTRSRPRPSGCRRWAHIATVGADGNPDVVPVWPAWQDDTCGS